MLYYSIPDIQRAYKISRPTLKTKIERGEITAEKLPTGIGAKTFKYVVPETELQKLEAFKIRNPEPREMSQPDYYSIESRNKRVERTELAAILAEAERGEQYVNTVVAYRAYLSTQAWREKRRQRLEVDGYRCVKCGTAKNLAVHHLTYERLGNEDLDDLITLCSECHKKLHIGKICFSREVIAHGNQNS